MLLLPYTRVLYLLPHNNQYLHPFKKIQNTSAPAVCSALGPLDGGNIDPGVNIHVKITLFTFQSRIYDRTVNCLEMKIKFYCKTFGV